MFTTLGTEVVLTIVDRDLALAEVAALGSHGRGDDDSLYTALELKDPYAEHWEAVQGRREGIAYTRDFPFDIGAIDQEPKEVDPEIDPFWD